MSNYVHPVVAEYDGTKPDLKGEPAFAGEGAALLGRATIGKGLWLGSWSVVRADGHFVRIGNDFHLGEHATVHIAHDLYPTQIGDNVTAGAGAVIHACTVGGDCVIEREAVVLDGSSIGSGAVISAGSIVFPRSELEGGWLYEGCPAKPVARVSAKDLQSHHTKARNAKLTSQTMPDASQSEPECFVAPTARLFGTVTVGEGVGIWYGCHLNSGRHQIAIGDGSNVQDNTFIACDSGNVTIGADVTIGHNVTLADCVIEHGSLVGIGAIVAPGTVVESDVLVAAGAQTEPGQRLTSGQVWAGRPARSIGPMDERKRQIMSGTLPHYRMYAAKFRTTRHETLTQALEE